jgi:outer membrane OprD family porin
VIDTDLLRGICQTMTNLAQRCRFVLMAALVAGTVGWCGSVSAEDAPPPPPSPPLEKLFAPLKEELEKTNLPPFLKDTDLKVHFRTYYFNRTKPDDSVNEAWAFGGWITYQSGWLLDTFSMGASLYGAAPLYAPDDRDGTTLLKSGQKGYFVPAEAWGALRYHDYALLTGYRQRVDQPYINPQDNRMTPNTFQGVTLAGKVAWFQYFGGYLWEIKPRNADEFISMAEQAGAKNSNDGAGLFGVRLTPVEGLRIDVSEQYGVNTFNTFYAEADYLQPLSADWKLRLGAQFSDQRAVGDALLPAADGKFWTTQQGGVRLQAIYGGLTLTTAFSITGAGNTIQSPWGSFPGYLSLIDQDFDRANEKAFLIGAAYDFSKLLTKGLSANVNFAWGFDAINPSTRKKAPDQGEYDFTVDYRPPFNVPVLQGMWIRARAAILDQQDAKTLGYQFRITINWDRDLI